MAQTYVCNASRSFENRTGDICVNANQQTNHDSDFPFVMRTGQKVSYSYGYPVNVHVCSSIGYIDSIPQRNIVTCIELCGISIANGLILCDSEHCSSNTHCSICWRLQIVLHLIFHSLTYDLHSVFDMLSATLCHTIFTHYLSTHSAFDTAAAARDTSIHMYSMHIHSKRQV